MRHAFLYGGITNGRKAAAEAAAVVVFRSLEARLAEVARLGRNHERENSVAPPVEALRQSSTTTNRHTSGMSMGPQDQATFH